MKHLKGVGFTIIETMLFLAISGFLFVAILASTGNSVNIQRYHDSVYSLHSFLQKQISEVVNVDNDSLTGRGQSDIVILGRFITTSPKGDSLSVRRVIGDDVSGLSSSSSDDIIFTDPLLKMRLLQPLNGDMNGSDEYSLEWGALLNNVKVNGGGIAKMSILILRSPNSGIVRTYINNTSIVEDSKIVDMVKPVYSTQTFRACVDSNGMISSKQSEILIHANASSQSDIEVVKEMDSGC